MWEISEKNIIELYLYIITLRSYSWSYSYSNNKRHSENAKTNEEVKNENGKVARAMACKKWLRIAKLFHSIALNQKKTEISSI